MGGCAAQHGGVAEHADEQQRHRSLAQSDPVAAVPGGKLTEA
jgi:hypothetical protein